MRRSIWWCGLVAFLLLAPAVRAAADQGEVTDIKKDSFTIKNKKGILVTYLVDDKLKDPKKRVRSVYWVHVFKDLKRGQIITIDYYLDGTKREICDRLRILKDVPSKAKKPSRP